MRFSPLTSEDVEAVPSLITVCSPFAFPPKLCFSELIRRKFISVPMPMPICN